MAKTDKKTDLKSQISDLKKESEPGAESKPAGAMPPKLNVLDGAAPVAPPAPPKKELEPVPHPPKLNVIGT